MNAETNDTDFRYRATSIDGFAECFAQQTYLSGAFGHAPKRFAFGEGAALIIDPERWPS